MVTFEPLFRVIMMVWIFIAGVSAVTSYLPTRRQSKGDLLEILPIYTVSVDVERVVWWHHTLRKAHLCLDTEKPTRITIDRWPHIQKTDRQINATAIFSDTTVTLKFHDRLDRLFWKNLLLLDDGREWVGNKESADCWKLPVSALQIASVKTSTRGTSTMLGHRVCHHRFMPDRGRWLFKVVMETSNASSNGLEVKPVILWGDRCPLHMK